MIRAALCEMEPTGRGKLSAMLRKTPYSPEVTEYDNTETLLWDVETRKARYDLYILDVCRSAERGGIDAARQLRALDEEACIVFLSGSGEFYREALDIGAQGYLTRPITEKELLSQMEKLTVHIRRRKRQVMTISYRSSTYVMRFEDIEYISSTNHILHFHLRNGEERICYDRLDAVLPQLDPELFARCHQSHVVNLGYVVEHTPKSFRMVSNAVLPISRSYAAQAKGALDQYLFGRTGPALAKREAI